VCIAPCWAADPLASVLACRAVTDAQLRLACFDKETATVLRVPAAPPVTPEQKFGLSAGALEARETAATGAPPAKEFKLQARITALALAGDGGTIFTLANAQVWRQAEQGCGELLAKLGDAVTISRGMLGSYWLALESGRGCKVSRLR
jgi:hypothetical protein